jgi:hypothetical protein
MRIRSLLIGLLGLGLCTSVMAQGFCAAMPDGLSVGGHSVYTMGGNIEESKLGFGLQAEMDLSKYLDLSKYFSGDPAYFAIELAGTMFTDEPTDRGVDAEIDVFTLALSAKLYLPMDSYLPLERYLPSLMNRSLKIFVLGGVNYNSLEWNVDLGEWEGVRVDFDVDNGIGYHIGGGASLMLNDNLEIFAEYRYTIFEGEYTVSVPDYGYNEASTEDYNFGFAKLGLNFKF